MVTEEEKKKKQIIPAPIGENSGKGIRFEQGGGQTITEKNPVTNELITTQLTREEAKAMRGQQLGGARNFSELQNVTPRVQNLLRVEKILRELRQRQTQGSAQAISPQVADEALRMQEQKTPSISSMEQQKRAKQDFGAFGLGIGQRALSATEEKNLIGTPQGKQIDSRRLALGLLGDLGDVVITGYDNARALVTGGDVVSVKDAKQAIKDVNDTLKEQLGLVETGQIEPEELLPLVNRAIEQNLILESKTKRVGLDNVRYWAREGAALEAEVERNRADLESMRNKIIEAAAKAKVANLQQDAILADLEVATGRLKNEAA